MSDFLVVSGGRTILVVINSSQPVTEVLVTSERLFRVLYCQNALLSSGGGGGKCQLWKWPAGHGPSRAGMWRFAVARLDSVGLPP